MCRITSMCTVNSALLLREILATACSQQPGVARTARLSIVGRTCDYQPISSLRLCLDAIPSVQSCHPKDKTWLSVIPCSATAAPPVKRSLSRRETNLQQFFQRQPFKALAWLELLLTSDRREILSLSFWGSPRVRGICSPELN